MFVNHILASVNHIRAFETYILAFVNYILPSLFTNQTQKPTAKEKAHLQTAKPSPKPTSAKELFPSPFSPPPKKEKISHRSNAKIKTLKTNSTAYNKGFARAGVKVSSSRFVFIENFVIFTTSKQKSPALAKPRHVGGNFTNQLQRQTTFDIKR